MPPPDFDVRRKPKSNSQVPFSINQPLTFRKNKQNCPTFEQPKLNEKEAQKLPV